MSLSVPELLSYIGNDLRELHKIIWRGGAMIFVAGQDQRAYLKGYEIFSV